MDKVKAEKHVQRITEMLDLALAEAVDVSEANVKHIVLQAKRQEVGDELAVALTSPGKPTEDLLEEYSKLLKISSLEEMNETGIEIYSAGDLENIIVSALSGDDLLRLYPESLADRIGGGLCGGHHLTLFARPEVGKSALSTTFAAGFARQDASGIYWTNEDRPQSILLRLTSALTGRTKAQVLGDIAGSTELAVQRGLERISVVSAAPGTPRQIEALIDKQQPRWVILDQLRNLDMGGKTDGNRVIQLEQAATFARNMAKKYNLAMISVTQAGESASNKAVLEMGDVDFSNTGIPAQADVMLGIGMTKEMESSNQRVFSLCKNKLTGDHSAWPVKIQPQLSRYVSI